MFADQVRVRISRNLKCWTRELLLDARIASALNKIIQNTRFQKKVSLEEMKDFQDAESVRSGNSHVTSQPMLFPKRHPFEGLLRPSFVSQRQTDGPPKNWDTSGISGNVFAHPQAFLFSSVSSRIKFYLEENY